MRLVISENVSHFVLLIAGSIGLELRQLSSEAQKV
ncbi:hypothetical protein swp_1864 [Shewanella piezotolerans WP3]|uniref:Uncharacterized protein n=1 Tax=Shewanella piezotolerans (strain WP3 / JCM 13877) TaxID=225849 RepID=B8CLH6_SHEPW|nr:hypothetical protein swp_1864 [Shewanella piezotolerans WP3]